MAFVVTSACLNCKHTNCVDICPVDAFRESENLLVIDPVACIDCGLCVPECPVDAIFSEDDVPEKEKEYIELNAKFSKIWPVILESITQ